ncbi:Rha family transcriptional regulator [Bacillus cereus]|nr:Rha family transcriptional regulator [Bacillus cereus]
MTNLMNNNQEVNYIDSLEVAEMMNKEHFHLLRDIDTYMSTMEINPNLDASQYFIRSNYRDSTNRVKPQYLLTRKGCELVANKMTGEKGILFTVAYIDRFHEMEKAIQTPTLPTTYKEALLQLVAQEEEKEAMQLQLNEQAPIVEYYEKVISTEGYKTVADTAKELGLRSPQELYGMLVKKNIIFKSAKGSYLHRPDYAYLKMDNHISYKQLEKKKLQLMISQKGKHEIAKLLEIV